jgi:hypothetical protein
MPARARAFVPTSAKQRELKALAVGVDRFGLGMTRFVEQLWVQMFSAGEDDAGEAIDICGMSDRSVRYGIISGSPPPFSTLVA